MKITILQRQVGNLADEIGDLQQRVEDLRSSARRTLALSALAALSSLAGALRGAALAARILKHKNLRNLTRKDALDLLSTLGPLGAAIGALLAATDLREAEQLARKAQRLESAGKRTAQSLINALDDYDEYGCGNNNNLTS